MQQWKRYTTPKSRPDKVCYESIRHSNRHIHDLKISKGVTMTQKNKSRFATVDFYATHTLVYLVVFLAGIVTNDWCGASESSVAQDQSPVVITHEYPDRIIETAEQLIIQLTHKD